MADWFAQNAPAAAGPPPARDWFTRNASVDMRPRQSVTAAPEQPVEQQGMFRSFYNSAIAPVVEMVKDTYARGDMGQKAASDILSAFTDQVKHFAGHPDVRNLPVVGPGATETAARMQKQYDAGNYSGMIGSAAGFIAPFAAPEVLARAPEAPAAFADAAKAGAQKLRNAIPEGPPISGAAADAVGLVSPRAAHAIALANRGAKVLDAVLGPKTAEAAPLTPGEQTVADMRAQIRAKDIEDAAAAMQDAAWEKTHPGAPDESVTTETAAVPASFTQKPAEDWFAKNAPRFGGNVTPEELAARSQWIERQSPTSTNPPQPISPPRPDPLWKTLGREPKTQPVVSDVGIPGRLPSGRVVGQPIISAEQPVQSAPLPAPAPSPSPAPPQGVPSISAAQRIEDAADEQAARLKMQAEDIEWNNRARKADRFASYLTENKLDPTPGNLANAAKAMGERKAPSDETVPMIQDRMKYQEPAAEPDFEQQLRDSIAAVAAKKAPAPTGFAAEAKAAFEASKTNLKTRRRNKP